MENEKPTIEVSELYFGKVGNSVTNPFLKEVIHTIFNDRIKKKKINRPYFSVDFKDTRIPWYSNFMNTFLKRKVECFFTRNNDVILIYPVLGKGGPSRYVMPEKTEEYVKAREEVLGEKKEGWKVDESSIQKTEEKDAYRLGYRGKSKKGKKEYTFFEHTVFKGIDKVIFQAFVLDENDSVLMSDIATIARSIQMK